MKTKKHEHLNLDKKRPVFFWIGMTVSLILVITAFEWRSRYDTEIIRRGEIKDEMVEIITSKNETNFKIVTANLEDVPMKKDDKIDLETWGTNSSERKIQALVLQIGQLVDSEIITFDERDKLIEYAKEMFK